MMKGGKVLEINPRHPLIQELRTRVRPEHASLICQSARRCKA